MQNFKVTCVTTGGKGAEFSSFPLTKLENEGRLIKLF